MGDFYNIVELAGAYYLEYQNENSGWHPIAVALTADQVMEVEAFSRKQSEENMEFMRTLYNNIS